MEFHLGRMTLVLALASCAEAGADVPKSAVFIVHVEDPTGRPLADLGVRLLSRTADPTRGVSDAHGEVRFTTDDPMLQVILDDPHQAPTTGYARATPGGPVRTVLTVLPPTALTGSVTDPAGAPIAAAAVEILPTGLVLPPPTTTDGEGQFTSILTKGVARDNGRERRRPRGQNRRSGRRLPGSRSATPWSPCKTIGTHATHASARRRCTSNLASRRS